MTCPDCYSPECQVGAAKDAKYQIGYGSSAYDEALTRLDHAEIDCRRRSQGPGLLARIGAIEARQDRIEAMLIAKGYKL